MRTLLVCGIDDEIQRISDIFAGQIKGMELVTTNTEEEALSHLADKNNDFGIMILHVECKSLDPASVYKKTFSLKPEMKFLFLGAQNFIKGRMPSSIYEDNPANNSLFSPYKPNDFVEAFRPYVKEIIKKETVIIDAEEVDRSHYIPMKIKNFYRFRVLPYDGFLELSQKKFIRVIKADQEFSLVSIQKYAKKGIKYIWLKKEEHLIYLENRVDELMELLENAKNPVEIMRIQMDAVALIHEHVNAIGVSEKLEDLCWIIIKKGMALVEGFKTFQDFFKDLPLEYHDLSEKAILCMYVSFFTLRNQKWESELPRHKVGLASILHDSMMENEDLCLVFSDVDFELEGFSEADIANYKEHTKKAADIAKLFHTFFEVDFIINQHHELPNGDGYPHGLYNNQISGLTAIFIVASNFSNQLLINNGTLDENHLNNTLKLIRNYYFEGQFLETAKTISSFFIKQP